MSNGIEHVPAQDELLPDEIHQMAFEEGQPAEKGDGYLFTAEEFDLFVERLLSRATRPAQAELVMPVALSSVNEQYDKGWNDHAAEVLRLNAALSKTTT